MKRKIRNCVLLLIVLAIAAYIVSLIIGADSSAGCLTAIIVTAIGGAAGLALAALGILRTGKHALALILTGSLIRLLLVMLGCVIILFFTKVNALWFVVWLVLFYAAILASEIWLITQHRDKSCKID